MDQFHPLQRGVDAFHVGSGLVAAFDVINAAHVMGASENLQAAVFFGGAIDGKHAAGHVRKQTAVVVPVAIILMPRPGTANTRLLEDHLVMVMINFITQQ